MIFIAAPEHGATIDARDSMYPTLMQVWKKFEPAVGDEHGTTYVYCLDGECSVQHTASNGIDAEQSMRSGDYFAVTGLITISGVQDADTLDIAPFTAVTITRYGFRGQRVFGGIEERGRLAYIDGCSDSILVYPPRQGDPVLNHLHFPSGILQTQHLHPSIRMGIVARGKGKAWQAKQNYSEGWELDLSQGGIFLLPEMEMHSFKTEESSMDIIAYHPDSDWGPVDGAHPMLNRTYINHGK